MTAIRYRPEIDGMRALAVISVILYHAGFSAGGRELVPGGFLGVDIFFVISGYLITGIILRELDDDRFSIARFYERRARRILPALFVVLGATIPIAWTLMLPDPFEEFAGSLLTTLGFGSNIFFLLQDSYTAEPSQLKPLLHTWSLGIEEQFYILYPLLLIGVFRYGRRHLKTVLWLLTAASLLLAETTVRHFPDEVFYLLPTRAWELGIGGLVALSRLHTPASKRFHLPLLAPKAALLMMMLPLIFYTDQFAHPSLWTAIPVFGAALFIAQANPGESVSRVAASRVPVALGLISYSLYLWHFPAFAFLRIADRPLDAAHTAAAMGGALVCSVATYFLIEKPARNRVLTPLRLFLPVIVLAFAALAGFGTWILVGDGLPQRLGAVSSLMQDARKTFVTQDGRKCGNRPVAESCRFDTEDAHGHVILVGDSHADALSTELHALARRHALSFTQITANACLYLDGVERWDADWRNAPCLKSSAELTRFLKSEPPSIIVYNGRLPMHLEQSRFDNGEGGVEDGSIPRLEPSAAAAEAGLGVNEAIHATFDAWTAAGHALVLVYPVPEAGWDVPKEVMSRLSGVPSNPINLRKQAYERIAITTDYGLIQRRFASSHRLLDGVDGDGQVFRIRPEHSLCLDGTGRCRTHGEEGLYYRDDNHLTNAGARRVLAPLDELIDEGALSRWTGDAR
ncbi:MAG: acyltransferase family protein [Gammaproteobacteria bacterium]